METINLETRHVTPRIICKYFPINNNLYDSILNNYLWFSDPMEFNDPYDCNLLFDTKNTEQEIREFISQGKILRLKKGDINALKIQTDKIVKQFVNNPNKLRVHLHQFVQNKLIKIYGLCCFSKDPLNLLMWSH